jgi:streptomycin 6-kinase
VSEFFWTADYDAWAAEVPRLAAECAEAWSLELEEPFAAEAAAWVVPAGELVLKLGFPHRESQFEYEALRLWNGEGAVRLVDLDLERGALLLERLRPGTQLWSEPEEVGRRIAATLLPRLWITPPEGHPFESLSEYARYWSALPGEPGRLAAQLADDPGEPVLLLQDFHNGNVLAAQREPWLAIDPKPIVGEREFDLASLLRDRRDELARDADPQRTIQERLDFYARELELDRERLRAWGIVQAIGWSDEGDTMMRACADWIAACR